MKRLAAALGIVALAAVPTVATGADGDGPVLVVDAPDLFRVSEDIAGPRFSEISGQTVYSNTGRSIGEIEDFVMGRDGRIYAVIDTTDNPIAELVNLADQEMMIVPVQELRRALRPTDTQ